MNWLAVGELGATSVVVGTLHCQTMQFFHIVDGEATAIPPPRTLNTAQACWDDHVWTGMIAGKPYAVEEEAADDRSRRIVASYWMKQGWSAPCSVVETHSVALHVDGRFCRPGMDCTLLERIAIKVATEAQAGRERSVPAIGPASEQVDSGGLLPGVPA